MASLSGYNTSNRIHSGLPSVLKERRHKIRCQSSQCFQPKPLAARHSHWLPPQPLLSAQSGYFRPSQWQPATVSVCKPSHCCHPQSLATRHSHCIGCQPQPLLPALVSGFHPQSLAVSPSQWLISTAIALSAIPSYCCQPHSVATRHSH